MPSDERRRIEELIARYELEPTLRDVYVEGHGDAFFIRWFLQMSTVANAVVYEIDTVEVDARTVLKHNLDVGNRGRLIAFGLEVDRKIAHPHQVTCIVDRDFDVPLQRKYHAGTLLFTDYTSLEMYSFNETAPIKFLSVVAKTMPGPPAVLLEKFRSILHETFFIRLVNIKLGLNATWHDFTRCCVCHKGTLEFDSAKYVESYLNSNSLHSHREAFNQALQQLRATIIDEPRHFIRGHDFSVLMAYYLKTITGQRFFAQEMVERSLLVSVEHAELFIENMFIHSLHRLLS